MAETRHPLTFVETSAFTRRVTALGLEESLRELQIHLSDNPEAGDLDPGTGGLRKVRISDPRRGQGKRGGGRVHYLWLPSVSVVYLMFVYTKDESSSLTTAQKQQLRIIAQAIRHEWDGKEQEQ